MSKEFNNASGSFEPLVCLAFRLIVRSFVAAAAAGAGPSLIGVYGSTSTVSLTRSASGMGCCDGVRRVPIDVCQGLGTEWKSHGDEDGGADGEAAAAVAAAVSTTGASSWSGRQERQN